MFPLGVKFTPLFTPRCEHSLLSIRMEGLTEFQPQGITLPLGDKLTPGGQSLPPGVNLRMALWKVALSVMGAY
jgi:hypothetical protein